MNRGLLGPSFRRRLARTVFFGGASLLAVAEASCSPPVLPKPVRAEPFRQVKRSGPCAEVTTCESSCTSGSLEGCLRAVRLMHDRPLDTDAARLAEVLSRACDRKDTASCNRLAELVIHSPALPEDPDRSKKLYAKSCELGSGIACISAMDPDKLDHFEGAERAAFDHAFHLLETSCDTNDGTSCAVLGALSVGLSPPDPTKSQALSSRGAELLEAACLAGEADECIKAAMQLAGPRGTDNSDRVKRLLDAGCGNQAFEACTFLANGPSSAVVKAAFLTKACDGGREDACLALGMDSSGAGATSGQPGGSTARAEQAFAKGIRLAKAHCDLADGTACETLAKSLMLGTLDVAEAKKTVDYLEIACGRHSMLTCNELSVALTWGPESIRDEKRAARLKAKACEQGYPFACADPMAVLGIDRPVFAVILDRRTGLEWAPVPEGASTFETATRRCRDLRFDGHADWRLPTQKELESFVDTPGKLRSFARATMPHEGLLFSNESTDSGGTMNLGDGRFTGAKDANGFTRCVRKESSTSPNKRPVLSFRMNGSALAYELRDARGRVLAEAAIRAPKETPGLGEDWDAKKIPGQADVEVHPSVDWALVARFLEGAKLHGLTLGRVAVGGKENAGGR